MAATSSYRLVVVLALVMLCSNFARVVSFTSIPSSPFSSKHLLSQNSKKNFATISSLAPDITTILKMASNKDERSYDTSKVDGTKGGAYFMAIVLLANVWLFTIPTEFRRAHIYPEGNSNLYSDPKAMTGKEWASGIAHYYANGGGVVFDFSIEGNE